MPRVPEISEDVSGDPDCGDFARNCFGMTFGMFFDMFRKQGGMAFGMFGMFFGMFDVWHVFRHVGHVFRHV